MERVPYLGTEIIKWRVGPSTFLAHPERGARLMNWHVTLPDGSTRDVIYWPELENLEEFPTVFGGNPILFPFCGRCFDQGEIFFWRDDEDQRHPMPLHGIARQGRFEVTRLDERGFSALFRPDADALKAYPFDYEFSVSYRFEALALYVELGLKNLGNRPLPWSAGHHFYFTLPWSEGKSRSDYGLAIPASQGFQQDLKTGKLIPAAPPAPEESFENPEVARRIHLPLRSREVTVTERGTQDQVVLRIGSERRPPEGYAVVTWAPDDQAPFFCVEPWMGPPNSPASGVGLHHVAPGETGTFVVEVALES